MLGVFSTPGWLSILAVGGTLGGVVVTQGVTAVIRRGDRRQERALDWERRVWQAKSDALTRLISACRFIKWRVQQAEADKPGDENYRRGAAIRALDLFRGRIGDEDGISEVTAYGAEPVCKALEEVLKEVRVQQGKHGRLTVGTRTHRRPTVPAGQGGAAGRRSGGGRSAALGAVQRPHEPTGAGLCCHW